MRDEEQSASMVILFGGEKNSTMQIFNLAFPSRFTWIFSFGLFFGFFGFLGGAEGLYLSFEIPLEENCTFFVIH